MRNIFLLSIIITLLPCQAVVSMTLEEAGKALSSENKQTQLKAEEFFKTKGWKAVPTLSQLMFSEDKVVGKKALLLWRWIMFGLNDDLPDEVRDQLLEFSSKKAERQLKILEAIQTKRCLHPTTAACLHSRVLELPYDKEILDRLEKVAQNILIASLNTNKTRIDAYEHRMLHAKTCAMVLWYLVLDDKEYHYINKAYPKWYAEHKEIRYGLCDRSVQLELDRIYQSGRFQEIFSLAAGHTTRGKFH